MSKLTIQSLKILKRLNTPPERPRYGFELARELDIKSGTLYPIMARLEFDGWVTGKWEEIDEATMKRRRRRYYSLTAKGKQRTDEALRALDIKILDC